MNFLLIIILIILFSIYFSIGIYFFKNKNDIGNFTDFVYINQYIFYATGFLNIFLSKIFKILNIKYLNRRINEGKKYAEIIQNSMLYITYLTFLICLASLFWFIVFKFNFVKKIIAVLFYLWIIFLTFHQVLDLNYIDFPRVKYLFYLICNFKFFLFILNVGLFFIINSIWLGFLGAIAIAIKLIFISIFHEFYDIPHS